MPVDILFGLPAHPFLVHVPIVMLPLAAIGVVVMAIRPRWHRRYRWVVLTVAGIGTAGAVLAASAGERLANRLVAAAGAPAARMWRDHAELGDTARNASLVFFMVVAAFVFVPWWLEGPPRTLSPPPRPLWRDGPG